MKNLRKHCLLIISFILLSFNACAADGAINISPNSDNVKFLGRSYFDDDTLWMCYSGTGAAFSVNAKRLDIEIKGDSNANGYEDLANGARIAVFVNGERKLDKMVCNQTQTYTVFNEKKPVSGEVRIVKLSETVNSLAGISKIIVDKNGTVKPVASKELKIEFIGDSITCGYGVDDLDRNHHFATSTEDNSKTYAYKTAELLDADYSMVCVSGWGIVSGYTSGAKQADSVLPKIYDKLGFTWGRSFNGKRPNEIEWDFTQFVPDIVVINLGTNDASYVKGKTDRKEEFKTAYIKFIKDIRTKNPEAKIICSLGIMGDDMYASIQEAVDSYTKSCDDKNVYVHRFINQLSSDGIAADWHPSEKTHEKAATSLVMKIKSL